MTFWILSLQVLYEKRSVIITGGSEEQKKYLILGDLHIGFEEKFSQAGVRIQSNYRNLAEEIIEIAENHEVTDIVLNGDLKSGTDRILQSEWEYLPKLLNLLISSERIVTVVPGNHDGGINHLLPNSVELADMNGVLIENNLILHGHTSPLSKYSGCSRIIMGHVHPIFQRRGNPLTGQPVWVFARVPRREIFKQVFTSDENPLVDLVVMPSFNKDLAITGYASEVTREERRVSPLVREIREAEDAMISTLQGEIIGDSSMLSSVL